MMTIRQVFSYKKLNVLTSLFIVFQQKCKLDECMTLIEMRTVKIPLLHVIHPELSPTEMQDIQIYLDLKNVKH